MLFQIREAVRRSQMFFKIGGEKFRKFDRKTPVLESFFNKVAGLERSCALFVLILTDTDLFSFIFATHSNFYVLFLAYL